MTSVWFVMPANGRLSLARICMRQLRRTCDLLEREGVTATAVVIADDENLDTARDLGFATVTRGNNFLSQKYNDGIQLATDPDVNARPADYVVPIGSDDWIDHRILLDLPAGDTILGFQHITFVREDGREMTTRFLNYSGGCGIRVYPRQVVETLRYRPADEHRKRACDTSILVNIHHGYRYLRRPIRVLHGQIDARQIVDWKSPTEQLNSYQQIEARYRMEAAADPFVELSDIYPAESLGEMAAHYGRTTRVAA